MGLRPPHGRQRRSKKLHDRREGNEAAAPIGSQSDGRGTSTPIEEGGEGDRLAPRSCCSRRASGRGCYPRGDARGFWAVVRGLAASEFRKVLGAVREGSCFERRCRRGSSEVEGKTMVLMQTIWARAVMNSCKPAAVLVVDTIGRDPHLGSFFLRLTRALTNLRRFARDSSNALSAG